MPSGVTTGIYEALELLEADKARLLDKGVLTNVSDVNELIAPNHIGMDVTKLACKAICPLLRCEAVKLEELMAKVIDQAQATAPMV